MSHHKIVPGSPVSVESSKPIVFILDDLKEEEQEKKRRRTAKKQENVTFKNFGAYVDINAFKQGSKLTVGWRCRQVVCAETVTPSCHSL